MDINDIINSIHMIYTFFVLSNFAFMDIATPKQKQINWLGSILISQWLDMAQGTLIRSYWGLNNIIKKNERAFDSVGIWWVQNVEVIGNILVNKNQVYLNK